MKTLSKNTVLSNHKNYSTLINAVVSRVGVSSMYDIAQNGIDGGFNGFIYYTDTHRFAMRHRTDIIALLDELADDFGDTVENIVAGFGVFRYSKMDSEDRKDLRAYLGGGKVSQCTITNVMAWFAAETVAGWFCE